MIIIESLNHINIKTDDLKKSIEFYTMFLDFELVSEEENSAFVSFDSLTLKLQKAENKSDCEMSSPLLSFIMDVDDFTDAMQEIEEHGYEITAGPSEIENGENVVIKDPGGSLIELYYQD
ncbi:MAG: VOC family protein [Spirochaetia bacterium]|nr:VOC family protein [Spirochaetia bacterium]